MFVFNSTSSAYIACAVSLTLLFVPKTALCGDVGALKYLRERRQFENYKNTIRI